MPTLSVIIVNYKTCELTLNAVKYVLKASKDIDVEIFVVDNSSYDGLSHRIKVFEDKVHFIESENNVGYAKANNMAINKCSGEYILLLNPDTVIEDDCLKKCLSFMRNNPKCGALGLKMYDGDGNFLRESKRGRVNLFSSFCRFMRLTELFPRSKVFSQYYLGHLSDNEPCRVNVLCGAFMMIHRKVLDAVGLLDERFFMYGEDIDLSYRIEKGGYECWYLPIKMIHYKGESSKQDTTAYIENFYNAMILFYDKYHSGRRYILQRNAVRICIYVMKHLAGLRIRSKK